MLWLFWIAYALMGLGAARMTWLAFMIEGDSDVDFMFAALFMSFIGGAFWPITLIIRFIMCGFTNPFKRNQA